MKFSPIGPMGLVDRCVGALASGEGGPVDEVVDRLEDTCHAELCRMVNLGEEDPTMFGLGGLTLPVNAINIMIMLFDPWSDPVPGVPKPCTIIIYLKHLPVR